MQDNKQLNGIVMIGQTPNAPNRPEFSLASRTHDPGCAVNRVTPVQTLAADLFKTLQDTPSGFSWNEFTSFYTGDPFLALFGYSLPSVLRHMMSGRMEATPALILDVVKELSARPQWEQSEEAQPLLDALVMQMVRFEKELRSSGSAELQKFLLRRTMGFFAKEQNRALDVAVLVAHLKLLKSLSGDKVPNPVFKGVKELKTRLVESSEEHHWKGYCKVGRMVGLPVNYLHTLTLAEKWIDAGDPEKGLKCVMRNAALRKSGSDGKRTLDTLMRCAEAFFARGNSVKGVEVFKIVAKWPARHLSSVCTLCTQLMSQALSSDQAVRDASFGVLNAAIPCSDWAEDVSVEALSQIVDPELRTSYCTYVLCTMAEAIANSDLLEERQALWHKLNAILKLCDFSLVSGDLPIAIPTPQQLKVLGSTLSLESAEKIGIDGVNRIQMQLQLLNWYGRFPKESLDFVARVKFFGLVLRSTVRLVHDKMITPPLINDIENIFEKVRHLLLTTSITQQMFNVLMLHLMSAVAFRCRQSLEPSSQLYWLEALMNLLETSRHRLDFTNVHFVSHVPGLFLDIVSSPAFKHNPVEAMRLEERFLALFESDSNACLDWIGVATCWHFLRKIDAIFGSSSYDYPDLNQAFRIAMALLKRQNELSDPTQLMLTDLVVALIQRFADPFSGANLYHISAGGRVTALIQQGGSLLPGSFIVAVNTLMSIKSQVSQASSSSSGHGSSSIITPSTVLRAVAVQFPVPDRSALSMHPLFIEGAFTSLWNVAKWVTSYPSDDGHKVLHWMLEAVLANFKAEETTIYGLSMLQKVLIAVNQAPCNDPALLESVKKLKAFLIAGLLSQPLRATGVQQVAELFGILERDEVVPFLLALMKNEEHLAASTVVLSPFWKDDLSKTVSQDPTDSHAIWANEFVRVSKMVSPTNENCNQTYVFEMLSRGKVLARYCPDVLDPETESLSSQFESWYCASAAMGFGYIQVHLIDDCPHGSGLLNRFLDKCREEMQILVDELEYPLAKQFIIETWLKIFRLATHSHVLSDRIKDQLQEEVMFWQLAYQRYGGENGASQIKDGSYHD